MDSEFLGDILECSVCLKPLDDQNKVLPCQHTFCKSCLHSIVKSRKELRCPECRIVVRQRVEDLPSNILLIRLLDGIRSQKNQLRLATNSDQPETRRHSVEGILSEPVPASGGAKDGGMTAHSNALRPVSLHERTSSEPASSKVHVTTSKPFARAIYAFKSGQPSDLTFEKGDTIHLLKKIDANWMSGECKGRTGVFPVNHVKILQPLPAEQPSCVALYDFEADKDDHDRDCLHFSKNDRILVIRKVDENWMEGILNEKIGIFPLSFVKLNDEASKLFDDMSSPPDDERTHRSGIIGAAARRITSNKQGGKYTKKRHSFPTFYAGKKKDDSSPSSSSHRHSMELGLSSSSVASPNSNNSSSSAGVPADGDTPTIASPIVQVRTYQDAVKIRLRRQEANNCLRKDSSNGIQVTSSAVSTTSFPPDPPQSSSERTKSERLSSKHPSISSTDSSVSQVPTKLVTALFDYHSRKFDELDLVKGDSYRIIEVCDDGWCTGTHLKSRKSGVLPGNYVTPSPRMTSSAKLPTTASGSSSSSSSVGSTSARTYEQFRQSQQLKVTEAEKSSKSSVITKSASLPSTLSPGLSTHPLSSTKPIKSVSPTPMKPLTQTSLKQNPFASSASNQTDTASSKIRTGGASASKLASSGKVTPLKLNSPKSPPPPRPVAPSLKLASLKVSTNERNTESDCPTSSRSLDASTYKLYSSSKDSKKSTEKDKKRDRGMLNKLLLGSGGGRKPKTPPPPRSSPVSSPAVSNKDLQNLSSTSQNQPSVKPLPRDRYRAIMNYPAQDLEELELHEGDLVIVHSRRSDGWFKGTMQRTGKTGFFPSTFVDRIPN